MKFILIAWAIAYNAANTPTLSMAEFDDRPACEAAIQALKQMVFAGRGGTVDARCLPKATQ